jgi:hypothetical protein
MIHQLARYFWSNGPDTECRLPQPSPCCPCWDSTPHAMTRQPQSYRLAPVAVSSLAPHLILIYRLIPGCIVCRWCRGTHAPTCTHVHLQDPRVGRANISTEARVACGSTRPSCSLCWTPLTSIPCRTYTLQLVDQHTRQQACGKWCGCPLPAALTRILPGLFRAAASSSESAMQHSVKRASVYPGWKGTHAACGVPCPAALEATAHSHQRSDHTGIGCARWNEPAA